jgi:1-deoxy-D-xylulose-5-phosphate synthase
MWDLSMLQIVPGLRMAAPRDETTLREELREAVAVSDAPTVVRFPKGALGPDIPAVRRIDGLDVLAESGNGDVLIVSVGAFATVALEVADGLKAQGIGVIVVDPRWVKPVPASLIDLALAARLVVVLEDGVRQGGVGSAVSQLLRDHDVDVPVRNLGVPVAFLEHAKRAQVLSDLGLTSQEISRSIVETWARAADLAADMPAGAP